MKKSLNDATAIVTPSSIYDPAILNGLLPAGFEHAYRLAYPKKGDWYLNLCGGVEKAQMDTAESAENLRLILRKAPRKQIILTEIRKSSQPRKGEYYQVDGGNAAFHCWAENEPRRQIFDADVCTIFKREDREI